MCTSGIYTFKITSWFSSISFRNFAFFPPEASGCQLDSRRVGTRDKVKRGVITCVSVVEVSRAADRRWDACQINKYSTQLITMPVRPRRSVFARRLHRAFVHVGDSRASRESFNRNPSANRRRSYFSGVAFRGYSFDRNSRAWRVKCDG